ncbi:hypothetical protein LOTGIDRAFT_171806 [Lottia gigantea]|uniref:CCHC-type domain-containing protein n=1 Tax=Lottia gigantea TaxID=225164 RepID=V4B5C4_LOTGI|nr:hypothetical protein LOTGIDRAFT_171806 [Lottia gigantea]ESP02736.1 hypothetical protein LOTGIDRAFT_171806 [Lottia gigantea]
MRKMILLVFATKDVHTADGVTSWMSETLKAQGKWPNKSEETERSTGRPSNQIPKLSIFYGESGKGEVSYDLWKYEADCLISEHVYPDHIILLAIRRSLKGEAGKVIMRLGTKATIKEILAKLKSVFGICEESESLIAHFYSARQKEAESVTSWACRVENLFAEATERLSSHKYDQPTTFDELRVEVRRIEFDLNSRKSTTDVKPKQSNMVSFGRSYNSELQELQSIVKTLSTEMGELKETVSQFVQPVQSSSGSTSRKDGNRRFGTSTNFRNSYHTGPVCWRCGKPGHLQMNCRSPTQHSNWSENDQSLGSREASRGWRNRDFPRRATLKGFVDKKLYCPKTTVMAHPCNGAVDSVLDISPTIMLFDYDKSDIIPIHISNVSTRTVVILPKAIMSTLPIPKPRKIKSVIVPEAVVESGSSDEEVFIDYPYRLEEMVTQSDSSQEANSPRGGEKRSMSDDIVDESKAEDGSCSSTIIFLGDPGYCMNQNMRTSMEVKRR